MSKTFCKSIKKDGSPCQGHGLKQFDGYCIAHGPADKVRQWRSRGGKNSATAARLDKRIPDRLKQAIDLVHDCMNRVAEGTLSPAACNAVCRCAKTLVDLHRRADEEMDLIRTEETQAAAAELAGAPANIEILETAAATAAQQDQYRAESLVDQGFAEFTKPTNPKIPPEMVLNHKGRRRFGYHDLDFTQRLLIEVEDQLDEYDCDQSDPPDIPEITEQLETMKEDIEETQSRLARDPAAPFDPLNGQPFTTLPARVKVNTERSPFNRCDEAPQEVLAQQRSKIKQLMRQAEELSQDEDYKRRRAALEKARKDSKELRVFLDAHKHSIVPPPQVPGLQ